MTSVVSPDDQAEFRRRHVGLEDRAEVGQLRPAALEGLGVAAQREGRQHLVVVVVPEADDDDEDERHHEEDDEDEAERHRLKPARNADPVEPAPGGAIGGPGDRRGRDAGGGHPSEPGFRAPLPLAKREREERGGSCAIPGARALGRDEIRRQAAMNSFHLRTM